MATETKAPSQCPSCQKRFDASSGGAAFCPKCRFPLMLIAGKYRLERLINQGGFGMLYLARHVGLELFNERVIKVLKPEIFDQPGVLQRFQREVQLTANLSEQNNHIVRIYDDFGNEPLLGHYYVMEYLRGATLNDVQDGPELLDYDLVFHIFYQLCRAMGAAHSANVIHRDLKPDNIFLIKRDRDPHFVKVIDFGLARPEGNTAGSITQQQVMGTPAYMSPEQCSSGGIDTRSDIYAMGVILYEMLTGHHPYPIDPSDTMALFFAHMSGEATPIRTYLPGCSDAFEQAVMRALAKRPDDRYASVELFWDALVPFTDPEENYPRLASPGAARRRGRLKSEPGTLKVDDDIAYDATAAAVQAVSPDGEVMYMAPSAEELLGDATKDPHQTTSREERQSQSNAPLKAPPSGSDSGAHSPVSSASGEEVAFAPTMNLPSFSESIREGGEKPRLNTPAGSMSQVAADTPDSVDVADIFAGQEETLAVESLSSPGHTPKVDPISQHFDMEDDLNQFEEDEGDRTAISAPLNPDTSTLDTNPLGDDPLHFDENEEGERTSISMAPSFPGEHSDEAFAETIDPTKLPVELEGITPEVLSMLEDTERTVEGDIDRSALVKFVREQRAGKGQGSSSPAVATPRQETGRHQRLSTGAHTGSDQDVAASKKKIERIQRTNIELKSLSQVTATAKASARSTGQVRVPGVHAVSPVAEKEAEETGLPTGLVVGIGALLFGVAGVLWWVLF